MQIRFAEGCDEEIQRRRRQKYKGVRIMRLGEHSEGKREEKNLRRTPGTVNDIGNTGEALGGAEQGVAKAVNPIWGMLRFSVGHQGRMFNKKKWGPWFCESEWCVPKLKSSAYRC